MARLLVGSAIVVSSVLLARLALSQTDAYPGAPSANAPGNPPTTPSPAPPNAPNGSYPPPPSAPPTGNVYPPPGSAPPGGSYQQPAPATPPNSTYQQPAAPPPNGNYPPPASAPPPNNAYQQPAQPPPPNYAYPPPASAPPANNTYQQPAAPPPNSGAAYASQPSPRGNDDDVGRSDPAEPPPAKDGKGFEIPDMSVRMDPLNWLIYGRLGLELEVAVWKFISVEMVPVFVTSDHPPAMNLGSFPGNLYQASNGLGAMSGTSIGAGFWLNGKPFEGTVLRFYYTNYGYRYTTKTDSGVLIDEATHTDRHLVGYLGSHHKWGPFTIATGIGIGVEMNRQRRCADPPYYTTVKTDCSKDVFELRLPGSTVNIYDSLHPVYLSFRLSLGFVF